MVRKLKVPKQYPAVLPHGPIAPPVDEPFYRVVEDPTVDINALGVMMYDSLERELAAVCGQDEKVAAEHAGRGLGPGFVWKDMCGTPASTRCRSSDISRAWGLTATWLNQLGHIIQLQRRQSADGTQHAPNQKQQMQHGSGELAAGGTGVYLTVGTSTPAATGPGS